ncbi:MAG: MTH938/NDUFAF3 family protein [Gammaproteobacteria bacterium]|nr:MTH938/NDUFAF3 family protein [Gammaproteobacteria bacterium]
MQFTRESRQDINLIRSHEPGVVRIGAKVYTSSLILSPTQIMPDWATASSEFLTLELLEAALAMEPIILLLGTGIRQVFPHAELMGQVLQRGIGLEVMDTAAACRTYNILASENRKVVAALIL